MRAFITACFAFIGLVLATPSLAEEAPACEAVPPIVTLSFESRYNSSEPSRATIDPEAEAEVLAALRPLDDFITTLADHTSRLYEGRTPDRRRAAQCVATLLGDWARADALSSLGTETVELTIGSRLASFGLLYWQAAPYLRGHENHAEIVAWLEHRVAEQMMFWETAPDGARRGNLRAWAALGAAAVSLMSERDDLASWAAASLSDVLCTAASDGSLPQEMARGPLALHYQLHAVAPLVTASALLERQGIAMQDRCDGALHRVAEFTLQDISGGNRTERITGEAQDLADDVSQLAGFRLAWIEPYLHLRPNADIEDMVNDLRPLNYTKLGGNQTALWGR